MEHAGTVLTRERLMAAIRGDSECRDLRGVDVHVRHLRQKLGPELIITVRGGGYRLADGPSASSA